MKNESIKTICLGLVICTISLCAAGVSGEERAALIIGISQYSDISIRDLQYADSDANELNSTLALVGGYDQENIILLTNFEATKKNIRNAFRQLTDICRKKNIKDILIFYSGHGVLAGKDQTADFRKIGAGSREFWAPSDADLSDTYSLSDGSRANDTFIKREWLASQIVKLEAKSITLLIDSCHSGIPNFEDLVRDNMRGQLNSTPSSLQQNSKGIKVYAEGPALSVGASKIALISATSEKDASREFDTLNHGAMSFALLKNIRTMEEQAEPGAVNHVTVRQLFDGINQIFYTTSVEGNLLVSYHKPQMFVMPDADSLDQITVYSVKGPKPVPIPKLPMEPPPPPPLIAKKPLPEPLPEPAIPAGRIELETIPTGATISIDGSPINKRTNASVELAAGKHLIVLQLPESSYRHVLTVEVKPGTLTHRIIDLRGDLRVQTVLKKTPHLAAPKIDVYLDGRYLGKSNLQQKRIVAGTHQLMVKYKEVTKTKSIEIRPLSPLLVRYSIVKKKVLKKPTLQDSAGDVLF